MRWFPAVGLGLIVSAGLAGPAGAQTLNDIGRTLQNQFLAPPQQQQGGSDRERAAYEQGRRDQEEARRQRESRGYDDRRRAEEAQRYDRDRPRDGYDRDRPDTRYRGPDDRR